MLPHPDLDHIYILLPGFELSLHFLIRIWIVSLVPHLDLDST